MKRLLITLLITLLAFTAFGQDKAGGISERYLEAKIREIVFRLHLTDQQKDSFVPIYRRYSEEMRTVVGEPRERRREKQATTEDAVAATKARIERQQAAQAVRLKYVDEFATVLEPDQMNRLYETENQIQQKLLRRKNGHQRSLGHPLKGRGKRKG